MKNIFRVRTPQAVEVAENSGADVTVPFIDGANDDDAVEALDSIQEPMPEFAPPESVDEEVEEMGEMMVETMPPVAQPDALPQTDSEPAPPELMAIDNGHAWLDQYVVPEMEAIQAEIQELAQFIREMEQRKADLQKKVNDRSSLRNALLAGSGEPLKQAVKYVFNELGVSVQLSPSDKTDLTMEHKGLDFVGEIAACDGPITLSHIRQLNHRVEDFIEVHGRQPKGLLIANPFADLQLAERYNNGHVAFPDELRLLAEERYRFGLVTAPQLFVAYCKFKEGQLNINEFMSELFETVWIYGNHRDFDRFQMSPTA